MKLIAEFIILVAYAIAVYLANILLALILCGGILIIAILMPRLHVKGVKAVIQKVSDG
jgi:hypothetical protein